MTLRPLLVFSFRGNSLNFDSRILDRDFSKLRLRARGAYHLSSCFGSSTNGSIYSGNGNFVEEVYINTFRKLFAPFVRNTALFVVTQARQPLGSNIISNGTAHSRSVSFTKIKLSSICYTLLGCRFLGFHGTRETNK